jgi:hypothetical protein
MTPRAIATGYSIASERLRQKRWLGAPQGRMRVHAICASQEASLISISADKRPQNTFETSCRHSR